MLTIMNCSNNIFMGTNLLKSNQCNLLENEKPFNINECDTPARTHFKLAYNCSDFITTKPILPSNRSKFLQECVHNVTSLSRFMKKKYRIEWVTEEPGRYAFDLFRIHSSEGLTVGNI